MEDLNSEKNEENGSSKLWAVYVSEAEKYDKSLVESWKSDMEGMLIFAGLFSASLTAFIVESYKTLTPDSGDATVQLLAQISQQLSSAANGTVYIPKGPNAVHAAPRTAIACNVLWFLSLGLSLTCALVATLLEQWARDFLHRAEMRSSPIVRARIYSYLYYGLKRFQMHTVVDIIPLLLHAALLLFFGGLVAFLLPINHAVAGVAAGILLVVLCVYMTLTLLPMWHLDCPYRTPLSNGVWRLYHFFREMQIEHDPLNPFGFFFRVHPEGATMSEAIINKATAKSPQRRDRDVRALAWTTKSLSDDHELEAFAEAIPDAMWGNRSRHDLYTGYMEKVNDDQTLKLSHRVENLFYTCDTGLLSLEATKRRRITCLKALWSLSSVPPRTSPSNMRLPQAEITSSGWIAFEGGVRPYWISVVAIQQWYRLERICRMFSAAGGASPRVRPSSVLLVLKMSSVRPTFHPSATKYDALAQELQVAVNTGDPSAFQHTFHEIHRVSSHSIFFDYLLSATSLGKLLPYRWNETLEIIRPSDFEPFLSDIDVSHVELGLRSFITAYYGESLQNDTFPWIEVSPVILELAVHWRPAEPRPIPPILIWYLNASEVSKEFEALLALRSVQEQFWRCIPITVEQFWHRLNPYPLPLIDVVAAAWHLVMLGQGPSAAHYDSVVQTISSLDAPSVVVSTIALIKLATLNSFRHSDQPPAPILLEQLLPETTLHAGPLEQLDDEQHQRLYSRTSEAKICLLAELLDRCDGDPEHLPFKLSETIRRLGSSAPGTVHPDHQLAFSSALHRFSISLPNSALISIVEDLITCGLFFYYRNEAPDRGEERLWVDNSDALDQILDVFTSVDNGLPPGDTRRRLNVITRTMELQKLR
ncbi:hypothetical protein C8F01DRAFT_377084 [Mycena amicta]|nr:hypothetical protein C8F01DRAFT_377084 [Mycena amicta]